MNAGLTRRSVLAGGLAGGVSGLIPFPEWLTTAAHAGPPLTRYAANTPQGQAMVAKYATGVAKMMQGKTGDPCSWVFQWYTHQVRGDQSKANVVASLPAPQQPLANDMWDTCQAHFGRPLQYFLPWHRMYVYFLERIVRHACGDPTFTLPYWDYMNPGLRALPAPFRVNPSALYRPNRDPAVNAGQAIDQGQPPNTINLQCLNQGAYAGFNNAINQNPHGIVHSLIGNGQGMGSVPWAANDSIFYFHHCNIDRYWASWNQVHPNPTDPAWGNTSFVFADEKCQRVLVKVKDFAAIGPLGYRYDKLAAMPGGGLLQSIGDLRLIAVYRPLRAGPPDPGPLRIRLDDGPVVLRLAPAETVAPLAKTLRTLRSARTVTLSIKNLRATLPPGTLFHVFVNLPANATASQVNSHFAGAISFFDAVMPSREAMADMKMDMDMSGGEGPSFDLDITDLLKRLGPQETIDVTIRPQGRIESGAQVSVGGVELRAG
ncbi:tyrosinase family protein [Sphingomonas bacterium]|uniref:tyrosinase family protein n=1 Tax=Sphingomonas bacterium TaxID=1895847 RepID=UPI00260173BC|nr:tyrosinase family protein [Sphingomonas bacterium]MDB5679668.1 hypothetical protein [Sphingomonas bacterium]